MQSMGKCEPMKKRQCQGRLTMFGFKKSSRCQETLFAYEKKLCTNCLLFKFRLRGQYENEVSIERVLNESDVVMALRKASGL